MSAKIEFLVATTKKENTDFLHNMNIGTQTIVLNQYNSYRVEQSSNAVMITTPTKGVGINRNIGLNLSIADYLFIVDDDMIFYNNINQTLENALEKYPDADAIIFDFDYVKDGIEIRKRIKKNGKINFFNCLNYGICCTLIKSSRIKQNNICFSTLFGGGCLYSCGEDSLFYLDCIRKKLNIYTFKESIGKNEYRESSWFKGYNEKFFFDKGAWIACAFPKTKNMMKWYFVFRFLKHTKLSF